MAKSSTPRARPPSHARAKIVAEREPAANSNNAFSSSAFFDLVREVSSLVTQVKIMWAIGGAIILAVLGGAWGMSSTLSELNRTIGSLQGQIIIGTESNKNLAGQIKALLDHLLPPDFLKKSGELEKFTVPNGWGGGYVANSKAFTDAIGVIDKTGKETVLFSKDPNLIETLTKAGAIVTDKSFQPK